MAEFLFQIAHVRAAALSRARLIHPAHETEKHLALDDGRRADHAPRLGILRLTPLACSVKNGTFRTAAVVPALSATLSCALIDAHTLLESGSWAVPYVEP